MADLTQLRRTLRARRRALPAQVQRRNSDQLARRLGQHPWFQHSHRVAVYWSADGEIDPIRLHGSDLTPHKQRFLPVLRPHPQKKLWFVQHRDGERLVSNRYGIPEPSLHHRHIAPPWALDIVLVPLVGFDPRCGRLGMGGGFYDRTFAYLRWRRHWQRPRLVGLAHECQKVAYLEARPWDVALDMIVTEQRIYTARRQL